MNVRKLVAISACGASLSVASLAVAQQAPPRVQQAQVQVGQGQRAQGQSNDQKLATCLAIANQEEVAIAKFAEEKTRDKDVKEFAQMLVKDHESYLQKLQRYAPEAAREGYLDGQVTTNEPQRSNATQQKGKVQPAGEGSPAGVIQQTSATQEAEQSLDFVQLHRELAQECIRAAKQNLGKKDSDEFDECFIGHQIAKHAEMKTKLTVFERHATGDLKQIIADGIETTENHLKKAEKIIRKLKDSDSSNSKNDNKQTQK